MEGGLEEPVAAPEAEALASTSGDARDPERFYCPHPGCNRSFAELWRLKVHYRAPPDVRGSGKERGHGTELEFCPKCGKDLKPGKHHVGCSASKRQSKRPRQADGDQPDSTRARTSTGASGLHDGKQMGIKPEDVHDPWSANAVAMANGMAVKLPPHPLQHHPGMPGPYYAYAAPAPNGMPPMAMWPAPGTLQQAPFAVLPGAPLPPPGFAPQLVAFHPHPALPHPAAAAPHAYQPMLTPMPAPQPQPQPQPQQAPIHQPMQPMQPMQQTMPCPMEQARNAQLAGMFDDEELDLARMPSPPPLPPDFSAQQAPPASNHLLFNFGQFSQRMPSSQPLLTGPNKLVKDLTQEALDLAKANVVYETHDDGDLMELLFGVADEMPTMATFHLHKFSSDEPGANQQSAAQASSAGEYQQQMVVYAQQGHEEQQHQQQQQQQHQQHQSQNQQQQHQHQQHQQHQQQQHQPVQQQQHHMQQQQHQHMQQQQQQHFHHQQQQQMVMHAQMLHQSEQSQGHHQMVVHGQVPQHQQQQHQSYGHMPSHAPDMQTGYHIKQEQQHDSQNGGNGHVIMQQVDNYSSMPAHTTADAYGHDKSTESVMTKESMMNNADSWHEKHNLASGLFDCG